MKSKVHVMILMLVVIVAAGLLVGTKLSAERRESALKKVFVVGDSISIQYGPYLKSSVRGHFAYDRKEGEKFAMQNLDIPQGANAGDSSQVLAYLEMMQAQGGIDADILLVNCGLHDIKTDVNTGKKQVALEQYEQNLQSIIDVSRAMGVEMVWIRTTPCRDKVHNRPNMPFHRYEVDNRFYNLTADEVMARNGIAVIDLYTFTENLGDNLYCDHVHFREEVRRRQAEFIAEWLIDRFGE